MTLSTSSPFTTGEENQLSQPPWDAIAEPDISNIEIEDGKPVDNLFSEKQQRLLTSVIYSSYQVSVPVLVTANVGLFYGINKPPLVPDVMVSLKVNPPQDWIEKKNRSYFTWNFGKSPEVAIEIVSNKKGNELGSKLDDYIDAGVSYYVVFDPLKILTPNVLQVYQRRINHYQLQDNYWLEDLNLGLTLWEGEFEGVFAPQWLRWCDSSGRILLTGDEKLIIEKQRAEAEKQRAEIEKQRAEIEKQRGDRLAEILRQQGIDPDLI